jgi:hypothetical protein
MAWLHPCFGDERIQPEHTVSAYCIINSVRAAYVFNIMTVTVRVQCEWAKMNGVPVKLQFG